MKKLGSQTVWNILVLVSGIKRKSWENWHEKEKENRQYEEHKRILECLANGDVVRKSVVIHSDDVIAVRGKLRRKLASAVEKKPSASLFMFVEVNNLEVEHVYLCGGVLFDTRCLDGSMWRWYGRSIETAAMESNIVDKNLRASWGSLSQHERYWNCRSKLEEFGLSDDRIIPMKDTYAEDFCKYADVMAILHKEARYWDCRKESGLNQSGRYWIEWLLADEK